MAEGGEVAGHLGVGGRGLFWGQDLCRVVAAVRSVAVRLKIRVGGVGVLNQVYMKEIRTPCAKGQGNGKGTGKGQGKGKRERERGKGKGQGKGKGKGKGEGERKREWERDRERGKGKRKGKGKGNGKGKGTRTGKEEYRYSAGRSAVPKTRNTGRSARHFFKGES